jgi:GntR family transcriptional regulator
MDIEIELELDIPVYHQIAYRIQELITAGELKPGDQLPTVRELAIRLGINFNTVARAYRLLDRDSVISTQRGRGTFVLDQDLSSTNQDRGESHRIEELTRFFIRKAALLGYKPTEIRDCFDSLVEEGMDENGT